MGLIQITPGLNFIQKTWSYSVIAPWSKGTVHIDIPWDEYQGITVLHIKIISLLIKR